MRTKYLKSFLIWSILLILLCPLHSYAQIRSSFEKKVVKPKISRIIEKLHTESRLSKEDTVYAVSVKKQHGWTMPLKKIDKRNITKYNKLYRFSNKNSAGNWCRVECIDGHGNFVPESFQTYIVKSVSDLDSDTKVGFRWKGDIPTVCHIDLISDPLGEKLIQERAFDKSGALVYSFSISPIDSNGKKYVGNYRDSNGLPSDIRPDASFSYGTLIYIERDKWGNDSIVRYIDSKGYAKPNSDGVYSEQVIHDKFGRLIKRQSMDSNGNPVNNASGNCGEEYEYDDLHNMIRITAIKADWSSNGLMADIEEVSQLFRYDALGRLIEMKYVNQYDMPIQNEQGIHKIEYSYNGFGDLCMICGFDKDGNPTPYDEEGVCKTTYVYDDRGNNLEYHNFDAAGNPMEGKNNLRYSSTISNFDLENKLIKKIRYKVKDGEESVSDTFEKNDSIEVFKDNYRSLIKTYSQDGRKIREVFTVDGAKIDNKPWQQIEEFYYNVPSKNIPFDNPLLSEIIDLKISKSLFDDESYYKNQDESYQIYAKYDDDNLIDINGSTVLNGETVKFNNLNKWGHISHSSEYGNRQTYNENTSLDINGTTLNSYGTDEFNDPSYIVTDSGEIFCYKLKSKNDDGIYLDEENVPIQDFKLFKDDCPKYLCAGVVDEKGFEYGFKENDIIISINDAFIKPYESDADFSMKKSLMSVLLADKDKHIKVFRIDPVSLETSIKDISIGKGNLEDYGVRLHCYYATSRQHERISTLSSNYSTPEVQEFSKRNDNPTVIVSSSSWKKDRNLPYAVQNGRDAVVLGAQILDFPAIKWCPDDGFDAIQNILKARGEVSAFTDSVPVLRLFVTNDGKTVKAVDAKSRDLGCQFLLGYVDTPTKDNLNRSSNSIAFANNENIRMLAKSCKDLDEAAKDSLYKRALVYDTFGVYDLSFDVFKNLAASGYSKAFSNITDCYANGKGTKRDLRKAEKYAVGADDGGASLCLIASEVAKKGNYLLSETLLKKVSPEDDYYDTALMRLGDLYLGKDSVRAIDYYFKALKNSNSISRNGATAELISKIRKIDTKVSTLDSIYEIAENLYDNKKYNQASPIYESLVDLNYYWAVLSFTECLLYGEGTERNEDLALSLAENEYIRSGNSTGIIMAAQYYLSKENFPKAIELYTKACNKGEFKFLANYYLSDLYANPKFYGNNTHKAIQYCVDALLEYNFKIPMHQNTLDKIENYLLATSHQNECAVTGLFCLGWIYLDNRDYEKGLGLIRSGYEIAPARLSRLKAFNRIYYYAMHKNGIPSMEEYESFMCNKIAVLNIPVDMEEGNPLYDYKGKTYKILSLNNWKNGLESKMTNIFDENHEDNVLVIEVDSKPVEIRTSWLKSSSINFVEI